MSIQKLTKEELCNVFDEKFGKLFTIEQLEEVKNKNKKEGRNWQPYPANESIVNFIFDLIQEADGSKEGEKPN